MLIVMVLSTLPLMKKMVHEDDAHKEDEHSDEEDHDHAE